VTRAVLALALVSQLAVGADAVDGGSPGAVAVSSATLRPLDSPTTPIEFGRGVCMPEELSISVAAKVEAYEAAKTAAEKAPVVAPSTVVWVVGGLVLLVAGAGFAGGWAAAQAVRPTAAQ
jgi:hypothetical protein